MSAPDGSPLTQLRSYLNKGNELDFVTALSRFLTEVDLPGDMLRKVDSMSMAASIEVRVPLLDHRIVEFAQRLPESMKINKGKRKILLRRLAQKELPNEILTSPKRGFAVPLHKLFDTNLLAFFRETLFSSNSQALRLFGKKNVEMILRWNESEGNQMSHIWSNYTINHTLWMMIQLEIWSRDKGIFLPDNNER